MHWPIEKLLSAYNFEIDATQELMRQKNHDYGGSWEGDRATTITDTIRHKIDRIRSLEELRAKGEMPLVSDSIISELHDVMNYAILRLIKEREFVHAQIP